MTGRIMLRILIVGVSLLLTASSCQPPAPSSIVTGKVFYHGEPLSRGQVYFNINDGGSVGTSPIGADGSYQIANLGAGEARIAVVVPPPATAPPGNPMQQGADSSPASRKKQAEEIPRKYAKPETSGLSFNVSTGTQTHDIELN